MFPILRVCNSVHVSGSFTFTEVSEGLTAALVGRIILTPALGPVCCQPPELGRDAPSSDVPGEWAGRRNRIDLTVESDLQTGSTTILELSFLEHTGKKKSKTLNKSKHKRDTTHKP